MCPSVHTENKNGWIFNTYVMFHGTKKENVADILKDGFDPTKSKDSNLLGAGIYVSTEFGKTKGYGDVTLKLLVATKKVRPRREIQKKVCS